jgi:hypothetical protein
MSRATLLITLDRDDYNFSMVQLRSFLGFNKEIEMVGSKITVKGQMDILQELVSWLEMLGTVDDNLDDDFSSKEIDVFTADALSHENRFGRAIEKFEFI